jgi:hypothetical protein
MHDQTFGQTLAEGYIQDRPERTEAGAVHIITFAELLRASSAAVVVYSTVLQRRDPRGGEKK